MTHDYVALLGTKGGPKDWQDACDGHYQGDLIVGHDAIRIDL